jgi:multidrug efflux pump subunit AcrB
VISADLTTIAAFLPMLLMVGVMGQFMSVLPKVVIFALIGSVFVDHLLLPAASARMRERKPARRGPLAPDGLPWFSPELPRARRFYLRWLESALRRPGRVLGSAAAAFVVALLLFATGTIHSIFLPGADGGRLSLDYSLPRSTSLEETSRVGLLIAREVANTPEVESYVLTTGDTGALNTQGREGGQVGPEYGRLTIELVPLAERDRSQGQVAAELRERTAHYAGVEIFLAEFEEGPPTGAPLVIQVQGEDLDELAATAAVVEQRVAALAGAEDVRVDYDRDQSEIRVDLDRPRAAAEFGIAPDQVSSALLTAFYGAEVGRMWVDGERVDLRLQAPLAYAHDIDHVRELPLRTADGAIVPLGEVAEVSLSFAQNAIFRYDTLRTITVRADNATGYSTVALEQEARSALASLVLPPDTKLRFAGEAEERDRSYASLWSALKWAALLIYVIMAIQFNSLLQPLIVLFAIPLSVVGVAAGLLVTGTPFSFMVFIGIVSLTGIVVNDGIVLIDAMNKKRRAGMPLGESVRDAAVQRFRPVLLTTVTTIAGLLPLTIGIGDGGEFWVPLGITVICGLLMASFLTLFVVPILYWLFAGGPPSLSLARIRNLIESRVRQPRLNEPTAVPDALPSAAESS